MARRVTRYGALLALALLWLLLTPSALDAQTTITPKPTPPAPGVSNAPEHGALLHWVLPPGWRLLATPTPEPVDPALVEAGRVLYIDNYCGTCHALAAAETNGIFGPDHDHIATVALERIADDRYRGVAATAEMYILESIVKPEIYLAPGSVIARQQMPPYSHLDEKDLDALVYFLLQQK